MYEIYCKLRDERGYKDADVANNTGITKSTFTDWKNGRSKPKNEKLQKIADYLGVSLQYLMTGKDESQYVGSAQTTNESKDIKKILANTEVLLRQEGLMFDGELADEQTINAVLSAMEVGMELAKKKRQEKFTPKKYKKEK